MPTVPAAGYPTGPEAPPKISPAVPEDFLRVTATPEAFGGAVGGALERAGTLGERGAGELAQAAISRQEFYNSVAADKASTEYMQGSHALLFGDPSAGTDPTTGQPLKPGFYALQGHDAINAGPPTEALDKLQRDISARLPNDAARLQFNSETRRLRTYVDAEIGRHWDEQLKNAGKTTQQAKVDLGLRDAGLYWNNPEQLAKIIETNREANIRLKQIQDGTALDDATRADVIAKSDAATYRSAIYGALGAGNYTAAKAMHDAHPGIFTGEQEHAFTQAIQPHLDREVGERAGKAALGAAVMGPPPSGSVSQRNIANNNPGNIKAPGGGWASFPTPQAGVDAIGDWMVRAQDNHGLTTVRQLIDDPQHGYAPSADPGNRGKNLPEAAARIVGVDPDAPIDMHDQAVRSKMTRAILVQEGNAGFLQKATGTQVAAATPTTVTDVSPGAPTPLTPPAYRTPAAPSGAAAPAGPRPMESLETLLGRIPTVDPTTGQPLTEEQQRRAENYVIRTYREQQQRTEETRARLKDSMNNGIAMLADGREFNYDEATIRSVIEPVEADKYIQALGDAKAVGTAKNKVAGMTPEEVATEQVRLQQRLTTGPPTGYIRAAKEADAFDKAAQKHFDDLKDDPAGYVSATNPTIETLRANAKSPEAFAQYATATTAEQARLGLPPEAQHVLGKQGAPAMVAGIMRDPEQAPQKLHDLQAQTGTAYPQIWHDLVTLGKMPAAYQAVGALPNEADAALLARALAEPTKNGKTWDDILPTDIRSPLKKAIDDSEDIQKLKYSMTRSGSSNEQIAGVTSAVEMLAYAKRFYSQDLQAAPDAIKAFTEQYEFMGNGGARVPAKLFDTVSTNAATRLSYLETAAIKMPEAVTTGIRGAVTPEDYMRDLKANPTWVTSAKADGITLLDHEGRVVRYRDNTPVTVRFDEPLPVTAPLRPPSTLPQPAAPTM